MTPARFATKSVRAGACLIWQPKSRVGPYGAVGYGGKQWLAHRLAFVFAGGTLKDGDVVRHRCDTPLCVEPTHLIKGTHADNVADKVERGRQQRGETHPASKLTASQVAEIRRRHADGEQQKILASEFEVSKQQLSRIVRGTRWSR